MLRFLVNRVLRLPYLLDQITLSTKTIKQEDTIVLSGAPRSGTTWLMEALGNLPDYATVDEPFNWMSFPRAARISIRPYIDPEKYHEAMHKYLTDVFKGQCTGRLPRYPLDLETIIKRTRSTKLVVKFTRANRLLPWISKNVTTKGVISLIRHPCSTVASQTRTGHRGYMLPRSVVPTGKLILKEIQNVSYIDSLMRKRIKNVSGYYKTMALIWALDYFVALNSGMQKDWFVICYEDLITEPERTIQMPLERMGLSQSIRRILAKLRVPSTQVKECDRTKVLNPKYQLNKWTTTLHTNHLQDIREVLSWFDSGFDGPYYWVGNHEFSDG